MSRVLSVKKLANCEWRSKYLSWIMDGKYRPWGPLRWVEEKLNSGAQNWKQYTCALLLFNTVLFVFGFVVLSLQPLAPLNPLVSKKSGLE